jgi:CelD/BcsL family acetyltransferase involved in cellulose biosynthesis
MRQSHLTIEVVDSAAGFAAMRAEWGELLASSGSDCLFLTWEWLYTWWLHVARHRRLFIVTVRSESQLIAIAPLISTRVWIGPFAVRLLEFAGSGTIGSDYLDVIVRRGSEAEALDVLAAFLADSTTSMRLSRISDSAGLTPRMAKALADRGWHCVKSLNEVCPFIDLSAGSWEEYLATVGSQHRYNFRRRLRNLMRDHDVRIAYAQSDDERRVALEHVISLHLRRWRPRGGSDAFNRDSVRKFHHEFSALALKRGWLRLMVIHLDGRPAAAFYGFRYRHRVHFYQSGFDPQFSNSSVGLVMIGLTIQDAIREGALEYDLLHGDEPYKFLWTKAIRQLVRLDLYPPGRFGRMHHNAARMNAATKRLAKRVLNPDRPAPCPDVQPLL